jgi:hypothetical protein
MCLSPHQLEEVVCVHTHDIMSSSNKPYQTVAAMESEMLDYDKNSDYSTNATRYLLFIPNYKTSNLSSDSDELHQESHARN